MALLGTFPRAVPGEDFERFARSVWAQAHRWLHRHLQALGAAQLASLHDVRDALRGVAVGELTRPLYEQEERLLAELVHAEWPAIEHRPGRATPEIPGFLVGPR